MGSKSGYFEKHQEGCPKVSAEGGDCTCPKGGVTVFPAGSGVRTNLEYDAEKGQTGMKPLLMIVAVFVCDPVTNKFVVDRESTAAAVKALEEWKSKRPEREKHRKELIWALRSRVLIEITDEEELQKLIDANPDFPCFGIEESINQKGFVIVDRRGLVRSIDYGR